MTLEDYEDHNSGHIIACVDLTVKLWNRFGEITGKHPADDVEMQRDIHNIQNRIFALALKHKVNIDLK